MSTPTNIEKQLRATHCWDALVDLLNAQLEGVDVQPITDKDFDGPELILNPPSVRVMYVNSEKRVIENQARCYQTVHHFLAICGDNDLRSTRDQAFASLHLAERLQAVVAGARLLLQPTQEQTEPVTLVAMEPISVQSFGVAYCAAFEVPGPSIFEAPNAYPKESSNA